MAARDPGIGASAGNAGATASGDSAVAPRAPGEVALGADPFDGWLQAELSRLYDAALDEPVPDDMIRLLQSAARRE